MPEASGAEDSPHSAGGGSSVASAGASGGGGSSRFPANDSATGSIQSVSRTSITLLPPVVLVVAL